ncbi:efflux RND transporter periplasmic adaptor subunit [Fimbriimonas ginsengisoli]|uniref:Secretion protein HlyD n=1 Tax=Fimbriimonas ginsengisoli Gsoil 348 TaxID=661478 RepID=A0A068NY17_FIMGI|nr:efflux RND transporter periplasmic adaptor subunit [Fimbriimonas ginsengisoli]AIE86554.1 secretion protein HlyD [Fimbriimonas ginsengisoli Gsoil 348]
MNRTLTFVLAGVMVLAGAGCVNRQAQDQAKKTAQLLGDPIRVVSVQPVSTTSLTETLEITGDVTAGQDATIGSKQSGRVASVFVKDGDTVSAGQLIAQLDTATLQAQLNQAQAQVGQALATSNSARSALSQALRNASVGPTKTSSAIRQAQAALRGAQSQLQKALNGARPEERRQAESNVAAAKSTLETQQKELKRIETLVKEGAIAGNRLDQQQNAVSTAQSQYDNAVQALSLIRSGTRQEDIDAARDQVRQAQESVRTAQAQKELDPLLRDQVDSARAQVESTRAQVQSAQAQVAIARQAIADAQIRAPFAGKILGKPIQAGAVAGGGTTVARLIGNQGVYFSGQVPSAEVSRIRPGLPVTVTVDALPGQTFAGTVSAVSPQAESVGRLFDVRIQLSDGAGRIKPGMFAKGLIQLRQISNATVVPEGAVVRQGDNAFVFIVDGDKAKRIPVTLGLQKDGLIQVSGVPSNAMLIVRGQDTLSPGTKVKTERVSTASNSKPASGSSGAAVEG